MAGGTSITIPISVGSFIAVYRKAANRVGSYFIDSFYAVSTLIDNSDATLSYADGILTIKNNASVAQTYSVIIIYYNYIL